MKESILIIDFGSQVTKLIARRIREIGVFSQIIPFNEIKELFRPKLYKRNNFFWWP